MSDHRYVVALDGSECSIRALVEACSLTHDGDEVNVLFCCVFSWFFGASSSRSCTFFVPWVGHLQNCKRKRNAREKCCTRQKKWQSRVWEVRKCLWLRSSWKVRTSETALFRLQKDSILSLSEAAAIPVLEHFFSAVSHSNLWLVIILLHLKSIK